MHQFRWFFVLIVLLSLLLSPTIAQEPAVNVPTPELLAQFDPENPEHQLQNRLLFEMPVDVYSLSFGGGNLRPNASVSGNPVGRLSQGMVNIRVKGVALSGDEFTSGTITTDDWMFITGLDAGGNEYSLNSSDPNSLGVWIWLGLLKPQLDVLPAGDGLLIIDLIEDQILYRQLQILEADSNLQIEPTSVRLQADSAGSRNLSPDTSPARVAAIDRYIAGLKADYTERLGTQAEEIDLAELVSHSDPEAAPFVRLIPFGTDAEGNPTSIFMPTIDPETNLKNLTQVVIPKDFAANVSADEKGNLSLNISLALNSEDVASYDFSKNQWNLTADMIAKGLTPEVMNEVFLGNISLEDAYSSLGIVVEQPPERHPLAPVEGVQFTKEELKNYFLEKEGFDIDTLPRINWGQASIKLDKGGNYWSFYLAKAMQVGVYLDPETEVKFMVYKAQNSQGEFYLVTEMAPNLLGNSSTGTTSRETLSLLSKSARGNFVENASIGIHSDANLERTDGEYLYACEIMMGISDKKTCDDFLNGWPSISEAEADFLYQEFLTLPNKSVYTVSNGYLYQHSSRLP